MGLVICNPFGFEEVCAHRSLRHLASDAAAAGFATLRFDFAGCGNSSGDAAEWDHLDHWIHSIHMAIDILKQRSGAKRICLVGLRLGATLATLACIERTDVEGLVAIAPIVQGRIYIRELRVLGTSVNVSDSSLDSNLLQAGGFVMNRELSDAIAAIDLCAVAHLPVKTILLVDRDDLPGASKWVAAVESLGIPICNMRWSGYRAMMSDPQQSEVPHAMFGNIVSALKGWKPDKPTNRANAEEPRANGLVFPAATVFESPAFTETPIQIDTGTSKLFGVLTTSTRAGASAVKGKKCGILILNSGAVHSAGPNRLWVQLARRWVSNEVTVLRIDLSGIGDSLPRAGAAENVVYSLEAQMDIALALKYMQSQIGNGECHLLGLCSGAYHAFKAAVAGQSLASVVMINPLTFFWTPGTSLNSGVKDYEVAELSSRYQRQIFSLEPWRKLVSGRLDVGFVLQVATQGLRSVAQRRFEAFARIVGVRLKNDLAEDLLGVALRGTAVKFVFATGAPGYGLLSRQTGRRLRMMIAKNQISIDFISGADHTFTRLDTRNQLISLLDALLLKTKFPTSDSCQTLNQTCS